MKYACVFPGQGSQTVGMLQDLSFHHPALLDSFTQVSEHLGYDVWNLIQQGPEEKLNQTMYTQVAMLVADVAIYRLLQKKGLKTPTYLAGHSLGEYAALVCAESLSLEQAASLVQFRGECMQKTVPHGLGAMAAVVGLSDHEVQLLCDEASTHEQKVTPANYNAIGQVVIAGHTEAVVRAIHRAEQMDARMAKLIPVSVPCHCPLLADAALEFTDALQHIFFQTPLLPVLSPIDLNLYTTPEQIRSILTEQLYRPVRWVEAIQKMAQDGVTSIVECGPGKVLTGLIKRIDKSLSIMNTHDDASFQTAILSCGEN